VTIVRRNGDLTSNFSMMLGATSPGWIGTKLSAERNDESAGPGSEFEALPKPLLA
jgi:hypothetical protein